MLKKIPIISLAFFASVSLAVISCGRGGPDAPPDTTPPTVSGTSPGYNLSGVPVNAAISVTFTEEMDPSTINAQTFSVKQGGSAVAGSLTYGDKTAVFTPSADLNANTLHTVTITAGVKDLAGNAMAAPYIYSFTTGALPDTVAPTVINATPANSSYGAAITAPITATFSEPMMASTITVSTFRVSAAGYVAAKDVTYDPVNNVATFVPDATAVAYNTTYTATIMSGANGVKDLAGNALASNYTWTFTTAFGQDATPDPFSLAALIGVAANTQFTSNPITVTGINAPAAISVTPGGAYSINGGTYTDVGGTITNGQTVTVRQTSSPNPGTTTTVFLTIGGVTGAFSVTTQ